MVADALNYQKKTAQAVMTEHADYLLSAKDNQEKLKKDIEDYVRDQELQKGMEKGSCFIMHALNGSWKLKIYKEKTASKRAVSKLMFGCLFDPSFLCDILEN